MPTIPLRGDYITLVQAAKAAGLADSGGQAKQLVRGGTVLVNGIVETRPGRKLVAGDWFGVEGGPEWRVKPVTMPLTIGPASEAGASAVTTPLCVTTHAPTIRGFPR